MRRIALVGICLTGVVIGTAAAQERSLDETLAYANRTLKENSFTDSEGESTVSKVELGKGTLVVWVTKFKAGNEISNVYEVALANINLTEIVARDRGGYVSLSLGATGPVKVRLVCLMASGLKHEWNLPDVREIALEYARGSGVDRDLTRTMAELVAKARKDPRYAVT
jgi:hypothetical protein